MKVLKVTTDKRAQIKDIPPSMEYFVKELRGVPKDCRPFVDKRIAMFVNSEPSDSEEINRGIPFCEVKGDVIFLRSKGEGYDYCELTQEMTDALIERLGLILYEEKEEKRWTSIVRWFREVFADLFERK